MNKLYHSVQVNVTVSQIVQTFLMSAMTSVEVQRESLKTSRFDSLLGGLDPWHAL